MTTQVESLISTVLMLPEEERAEIARRVLESFREQENLHGELDEWRAEIRRRVEASDRGEAELVPASDVIRAARERFE